MKKNYQHNNWRDAVEEIQAERLELAEYGQKMSEYDRDYVKRKIKALAESNRPLIVAGVTAEWRQALDGYQAARKQVIQAKAKEVSGWDYAKLATIRMDVTNTLIQLANSQDNLFERPVKAERLERLYSEALLSNDTHYQRAIFEALGDSSALFGNAPQEIKFLTNRLGKESTKQLEALRVTDEMRAADQAEAQALDAALEKRQELLAVLETVDDVPTLNLETKQRQLPIFFENELTRAAKELDYDRENGIYSVLAPNDPKVTGVNLENIKNEAHIVGGD